MKTEEPLEKARIKGMVIVRKMVDIPVAHVAKIMKSSRETVYAIERLEGSSDRINMLYEMKLKEQIALCYDKNQLINDLEEAIKFLKNM